MSKLFLSDVKPYFPVFMNIVSKNHQLNDQYINDES